MNKETWTSLSKEAQDAWDGVPKPDKAKILDYGRARGGSSKANVHVLEESNATKVNTHEVIEPKEEAQGDGAQDERPTISANNVITSARKEAHPGDPRRVMGSNDDPVRSNLQAMLHRLTSINDDSEEDDDSDFESYWEETDFHQGFR